MSRVLWFTVYCLNKRTTEPAVQNAYTSPL